MTTKFQPPFYEEHEGTIRISATTVPQKAASCAMHFIRAAKYPVDILFIGAAAGQQATKALFLLASLFEEERLRASDSTSDFQSLELSFTPLCFSVKTDGQEATSKIKYASVWRTNIHRQMTSK